MNVSSILFTVIVFLSVLTPSFAQTETKNQNPNYDASLAQKTGTEDYGMKLYVFVILKTGKNQPELEKTQRDSLVRGHLNNICSLAEPGKLVIADLLEKMT